MKHIPVLYEQVIKYLNIDKNSIYIDATLGGGGHSYGICKRLENGHLIGIDQDETAVLIAGEKLKEFSGRVTIIKDNFYSADLNQVKILKEKSRKAFEGQGESVLGGVKGVLMDLGVSSFQLDDTLRGFSYKNSARLDMRMDTSSKLSAYEVVNLYNREKLTEIIFRYGEEKFSNRIVKNILKHRNEAPIKTTTELAEIIKNSIPYKYRSEKGHPAKRTFQAIRIEVNRELEILEESIYKYFNLLESGGRFVIITFHSLEDRIVKNTFRTLSTGCTCTFPICICENTKKALLITRKPITASLEELDDNNRAKSAKLRVIEKL